MVHCWNNPHQVRSYSYALTTLTKDEILHNHRSVLFSFGISNQDGELDLPLLYWILKLYKGPFKHSVILLGLPNAPRNLLPNY